MSLPIWVTAARNPNRTDGTDRYLLPEGDLQRVLAGEWPLCYSTALSRRSHDRKSLPFITLPSDGRAIRGRPHTDGPIQSWTAYGLSHAD